MTTETAAPLLDAHRSGDLAKLEAAWPTDASSLPDDVTPLLAILDELVGWGEGGRATTLLESLLVPLGDGRRWSELETALRRLVALREDGSPPAVDSNVDLGSHLALCFRNRFSDCASIDAFIEWSGIRSARPIGPALEQMDILLDYKEGEVVLHESGWGVGLIRGFDPDDSMLIVDFAERKGHKISPNAAPKLLKRLESDDIRALKVTDPDRLKAMAKDDPVGLVRMVLASRTRKCNASRIKAMLAPDVIATKSWTNWWSKTRRAASTDPLIRCQGQGAGAEFSLRAAPADPAQEALTQFRTAADGKRRAQVALDAGKGPHAGQTKPAIVDAIKKMTPTEPADVVETHLLLEALGDAEPGDLDVDALGDPAIALQVLTGIQHPELRRQAFSVTLRAPITDRVAFLHDAFFAVDDDLWDTIIAELGKLEDAGAACRDKILQRVARHPRREPDRYGWLASRALRGSVHADNLPDAASLVRKLVDAVNHVSRNDHGQPGHRDRLNRIASALTERDGALLEKVLASISAGEAYSLKDRFDSCLAFTEGQKRELNVRVARAHPQRPDRAYDEDAGDDEGVSFSSDVIWTTKQGLEKRRRTYEKLVNEDIPKGQQALNQAASYGDLSENAEWSYALEQQDQMTKRAERMEAELNRARVIDASQIPTDRTAIGNRGVFRDEETNESVPYTVLGPWEADADRNILSYDSPLGRQLLNRGVGDTFEVKLPVRTMRYTLERIEQLDG